MRTWALFCGLIAVSIAAACSQPDVDEPVEGAESAYSTQCSTAPSASPGTLSTEASPTRCNVPRGELCEGADGSRGNCATGLVCWAGICRAQLGSTCTLSAECVTLNCIKGFCAAKRMCDSLSSDQQCRGKELYSSCTRKSGSRGTCSSTAAGNAVPCICW